MCTRQRETCNVQGRKEPAKTLKNPVLDSSPIVVGLTLEHVFFFFAWQVGIEPPKHWKARVNFRFSSSCASLFLLPSRDPFGCCAVAPAQQFPRSRSYAQRAIKTAQHVSPRRRTRRCGGAFSAVCVKKKMVGIFLRRRLDASLGCFRRSTCVGL